MRRHRAALVGLALALVATTGSASAAGLTQDDTASASSLALEGKWADWTTVKPDPNTPVNPQSQAYFRHKNVRVLGNGDLGIRTMRHCLAGVPTEETTAHPAKCGSKETTKYTTGRVQTWLVEPGTGSWRVTFRAKVPQRAAGGTRSALWLLNQPGLGYCKGAETPTFGEIDVLEWYTAGSRERRTTATTHLECKDNTHVSEGGARGFVGSRAKFHDWSVTRRGSDLTYRMDGKVVLRHTCNEGGLAGVERCAEILDANWLGIMQGEVFKNGPGAGFYAGPSWEKPFPTIELVIRDVTVERL